MADTEVQYRPIKVANETLLLRAKKESMESRDCPRLEKTGVPCNRYMPTFRKIDVHVCQ